MKFPEQQNYTIFSSSFILLDAVLCKVFLYFQIKMLYSPEAEGQCLNLVVESVGQQQVRGHVCQLEQAGHLAGQLLCPDKQCF